MSPSVGMQVGSQTVNRQHLYYHLFCDGFSFDVMLFVNGVRCALKNLIDLTRPPAFPPTGLMLERISPRQVYVVGSATSALGLGYVSLAIGKVTTATVV